MVTAIDGIGETLIVGAPGTNFLPFTTNEPPPGASWVVTGAIGAVSSGAW